MLPTFTCRFCGDRVTRTTAMLEKDKREGWEGVCGCCRHRIANPAEVREEIAHLQRLLTEAHYRNPPVSNKVPGIKGLVDCTPPNGYSLEIVLSPLATLEEVERALAYSEQTYGTRGLATDARDHAIEEEGLPPASVRIIPCE